MKIYRLFYYYMSICVKFKQNCLIGLFACIDFYVKSCFVYFFANLIRKNAIDYQNSLLINSARYTVR